MLSVLLGEVLAGAVSASAMKRLESRLAAVGLAEGHAPRRPSDLAHSLEGLLQRVQYSIGERELPPTRRPLTKTVHRLQFPDRKTAALGLDAIQFNCLGTSSRKDSSVWIVEIVCDHSAPDPEFFATEKALLRLAKERGGRYLGSHAAE